MPSYAPNTSDATTEIPLENVATTNDHDHIQTYGPLKTTMSEKSATGSMRQRTFGHRVKQTASNERATVARNKEGELVTLNTMGKVYRRILDFSIITRYFLYVLPLGLAIAVPIVVGATASKDAKIGGVRIVWFFTWVEIVWLSLWVSKVVVHFLPTIFTVLAGVVSSGTRKYALILNALSLPLSFVGWSVTSLATFMPLMTQNPTNRSIPGGSKPQEWENIVQSILGAWVTAMLIVLIEKFLIQLISINYHRKQFNAKIRDSKHNVYLVGLLYDASRKLFPMYCAEFAEEDYTIADQLNLSALGSKGRSHQRSGSNTPAKLLLDVGKFGDKVTSAFGNVAHEITGKQVFNPNSAHAIVVQALERNQASAALAKRLWMSFVIEGRDTLHHDDIVDVLGPEHEDEAEECFTVLDRDGNGDVSLEEMILTITEIGRERKSIASSLHDVDQAINVLDRLLLGVCFIAIIFVFVAFLNKNFVTTLATAGTALLSLSFVFSITAQEFLGSCIFLFVKHPYDIGDMVFIGTTQEQLVVDHISLLFSVFRRASGPNTGRLVQVPHIILNTLWIENVSRSKAMKEQLSLMISFDTTFEDIQLLKQELLNFVLDKENSRDFQSDFEVEVLGTSDMSKLELRIEVRHKSNWANESIRASRRSKFMCAMVAALRRVPIYGPGGGGEALGTKANASYTVAISDKEAKGSADDVAKTKDAARLVPAKSEEAVVESDISVAALARSQSRRTEQNAIADLTSRSMAYDITRGEPWTTSREDESTLDDTRPEMDHNDVNEVHGIMRKESTKGRRRADSNSASLQRGLSTVSRSQSQSRGQSSLSVNTNGQQAYPFPRAGSSHAGSMNMSPPHSRDAPAYNALTPLAEQPTPMGSTPTSRMLPVQNNGNGTQTGPNTQRVAPPQKGQPRHYEDV